MDRVAFTLPDDGVLLGDGAMGTTLQAAGFPLGKGPERWNLERPEVVTQVHAQYAAAGARWVGTNTFGGTLPRLEEARLGTRLREVNQAAVRCARQGAPGLPVLGVLGPVDPLEGLPFEAAYAEQVETLAEAGVDGFLVETAVSLSQATAGIRAAVAAGVGPVLASFTPGRYGMMLDGTSPERAAEAFFGAGALVAGANCGAGMESVVAAVTRMAVAGLGPVLAAPSAGLPQIAEGKAVYSLTPDRFARHAIQFREAGVRLVAGCCGVGPEHIRAAAEALGESSPTHQGEQDT